MGLLNPHLDDGAFAQIWADRTSDAEQSTKPAERHLQGCVECRTRYAAFTGWLDGVRDDARAEADEAFSAERLSAQQAQIQRRLAALEHPARVIAFPRFARPISVQHSASRRWVAMAAAAGLVVGLGLGQVMEFGASRTARPETTQARTLPEPTPRMAVQPVSMPGDETFLYEAESTAQPRVPESLQYLNAITPTSRDLDAR